MDEHGHDEIDASPSDDPIDDPIDDAFDDAFDDPGDVPDDDPDDDPEHDPVIEHLRSGHGFDDASVVAFLAVTNAAIDAGNLVLGRQNDFLEEHLVEAEDLTEDELEASLEEFADEFDLWVAESVQEVIDDAELLEASLGHLLAETARTAALVHDGVGADHLTAATLLTLLDEVRPTLDRQARANSHWLRARLLEFVGADHTAAERELRRVLDLDPHHGEGVFDLARYRADRGEAGAALGLLRQLRGNGGDPEWVDLLERYASAGPTSAGRNEPCPCGSGRKHKACCARHNGWPLALRVPWLFEKITRHLTSAPAASLAEPVQAALEPIAEDDGAVDDELVSNLLVFDTGLMQHLVETRGALLPADELELLRIWAEVRAGAYEVLERDGDEGLGLLDPVTGAVVALDDEVGPSQAALAAADLVLAWILPLPDGPFPLAGMLAVPEAERGGLQGMLEEGADAGAIAEWYAQVLAGTAP